MKEIIQKIIKKYIGDSGYKKNIVALTFGRIGAQVIPILLTPVLTRLYTPEEFGVFGVYSTIIALVAMVSSGRYCLAIVLPKSRTKAQSLLIVSSLLTFVVSVTFLMALLLTKGWLFEALNVGILNSYFGLVVLNILFIGLYEPVYYYALRSKKYKILATNIIIQALVVIASRLLLGYLSRTQSGLLLSHLLGYSVSYILLFLRLKLYNFNLKKGFKEFRELIKKYSDFPRYSFFADILSMTANLSSNLFLNKIFGSVPTGYYAMSDKFLGSPIWLITSSVGDVFKQEASERYRGKRDLYDIFLKTTKSLFILGLTAFVLIFLFVPYFIPFLLGPGWEQVGLFIRIFSIMYFFRFVVTPVSYIAYIVNKQKLNILFQGMRFGALVIAFILGYLTNDLYSTLIIWSLLTTLSYIIIFMVSLNLIKSLRNKKVLEEATREFLSENP